MHFLSSLSSLSSLSFFSTLLSSSTAAPIPHAGIQLTTTTFPFPSLSSSSTSSSSDDSWLIEFYSPYCPHCRRYAPKWVELVNRPDIANAHLLKMGQVDCVAYGDLCDTQDIKFYPTFRWFNKSGAWEEFKGDREPDKFAPWILEKLAADPATPKPLIIATNEEFSDSEEVLTPDEDSNEESSEDSSDEKPFKEKVNYDDEHDEHVDHDHLHETEGDTAEAQKDTLFSDPENENDEEGCLGSHCISSDQPNPPSNSAPPITIDDDKPETLKKVPAPVLRVQKPHKPRQIPNQSGEIIYTHSIQEFDDFINPLENRGPVFAAFKAPWCSHCKKLAPLWKETAERLKGIANIVEVDCEAGENKRLCKREKVEGFPTLFLWNHGQKIEYRAKRKVDEFEKFVKKAIAATGVRDIETVEEFKQVLDEEEVLYLFLHKGDPNLESEILATMNSAAKKLAASQVLSFQSTSPELATLLSIPAPAIVVFKSHSSKPYNILSLPASDYTISNFLFRNRFPVLSELSSANFNIIMEAPERPLVVITALSHSRSTRREVEQKKSKLRASAEKWLAREKADGQRDTVWVWVDGDQWGSWLNSMYGMKGGVGTVVADHTVKAYWDEWRLKETVQDVVEEQIFALVQNVLTQQIQPKSSQAWYEVWGLEILHIFMVALVFVSAHPFWSLFLLIFAGSAAFFALKRVLEGPNPRRTLTGTGRKPLMSDRDFWGGEKKTRLD